MKILHFIVLLLFWPMVSCFADTIPLQVTMTAPRTVTLVWSQSCPTEIYRQYPTDATPVFVTAVTASQYVDRQQRAVCGDTVRYSIRQTDGDVLHEGFAAQYMSDDSPTAPAQWGVVTVDASGQALLLQWQPSADTDIMGYMVCEGTPSIAIDTVFGRLNTQYSPQGYAVDSVWHFRVCAFDSCRQASPLTDVCNNMVVTLDTDPCSRQVDVQWNEYLNMPDGVSHYEVWAAEDGGTLHRVAEVGSAGPYQTSFEVGEATMAVAVEVRMVPAQGQQVSCSNRVGETFATSERPNYFYLRKVSVCDDDATVQVVAQTDPAYDGINYTVYRSIDHGAFYAVGHCSPDADGTLRWQDHSVHPAELTATYRLGVTDGCGRNELFTQRGSTLLPQLEEQGETMTLSWNPYDGWDGTTQYVVTTYDVDHHVLSTQNTTSTIVTLSSELQGPRHYRVSAYEGANSHYGRDDSLQSVTISYCPQTDIWIPNVFTPKENSNNLFRPYFSYVDPASYRLSVYNRQGLLVFDSTDPEDAWDGTSQGMEQPQGVYVYKVEYQANNMKQHKVGTLLLIK